MAQEWSSPFDHPDWQHFDGEDQVRADTQARLDEEERTRQALAEHYRRMAASRRYMIVSMLWVAVAVVLAVFSLFGSAWFLLASFTCSGIALARSGVSMARTKQQNARTRARMAAQIRSWQQERRGQDPGETDSER